MRVAKSGQSSVGEGGKRGVLVATHEQVVVHGGPIPCAEELEKYEKVLPGAADRILSMAEKQSDHRQKLESKVVDSNIKRSYAGQVCAFVITALVLIAGFILISLDKDVMGLVLVVGDLAVLASVFIGNRVIERKERKEKIPKDD